MRYLLLLAASASLSACSIFEQPHVYHSGYNISAAGQYDQSADCVSYDPCSAAGGYGVASAASYPQYAQQNVITSPADYSPATSLHIGPGTAVTFGSSQGCSQPCTSGYSQGQAQAYVYDHAVQNIGYQDFGGYPAAYGTTYAGYHHGPFGVPALRGRSNAYNYGNLGGVIYDVDDANYGLIGRIGRAFSPYFAIEGEGSLNLKGQDVSLTNGTNTITGSAGVDYNVAAFALTRLPLTKNISVHSRFGYDYRKFSAEITDGTTTADDSVKLDGFAYGGGAEFAFNPRDAVRLDYTRYENDRRDFDSVSATYVRKF